MKQLCLLVIMCFITLCGCSEHDTYYQPHVDHQLLTPSWRPYTEMNPTQWTKGAGHWFVTGEPGSVEVYAKRAPYDQTMTITATRVSNFTKISIEGSFQVQIVGDQECNSVVIVGPDAEKRQIAINVTNHMLSLKQDPNSKTKLSHVIVRIGIQELRQLDYVGCSNIAGRNIGSSHLVINSHGSGMITLAGLMNVTAINQDGSGTITLLGVQSRHTSICVKGPGTVNVNGCVGVYDIQHHGNGAVRVLGANANALNINASGKGLTAIVGYSRLDTITAQGDSQVYLYWLKGDTTTVTEADKAHVGLAGSVGQLNLTLRDSSHFDGRFLQTQSLDAILSQWAHANVRASRRAFITASGDSSVYFFGSMNVVSANTGGRAAVIPLSK